MSASLHSGSGPPAQVCSSFFTTSHGARMAPCFPAPPPPPFGRKHSARHGTHHPLAVSHRPLGTLSPPEKRFPLPTPNELMLEFIFTLYCVMYLRCRRNETARVSRCIGFCKANTPPYPAHREAESVISRPGVLCAPPSLSPLPGGPILTPNSTGPSASAS